MYQLFKMIATVYQNCVCIDHCHMHSKKHRCGVAASKTEYYSCCTLFLPLLHQLKKWTWVQFHYYYMIYINLYTILWIISRAPKSAWLSANGEKKDVFCEFDRLSHPEYAFDEHIHFSFYALQETTLSLSSSISRLFPFPHHHTPSFIILFVYQFKIFLYGTAFNY